MREFNDYDTVMIVEGVEELEHPYEYLEAIAHLIKTGLAWTLQGFFGRTCMGYIEEGLVSRTGDLLIDRRGFEEYCSY